MYEIKGSGKNTRIILTRGDSFYATVVGIKDGGSYIPAEGDVIRFAMKKDYSDSEPIILKNVPTDTLGLALAPAETKPLSYGDYVFDIQLTTADGDVDTFISGTITLGKEVA